MGRPTLQAFIAVTGADLSSDAGKRLHLTQPAISKRVHQLENEPNARLFDCTTCCVQFTEAGRTLLPGTRGILIEIKLHW